MYAYIHILLYHACVALVLAKLIGCPRTITHLIYVLCDGTVQMSTWSVKIYTYQCERLTDLLSSISPSTIDSISKEIYSSTSN